MTMQPRLLPDFAAAPTRRERAAARAEHRAAQLDLFAAPEPEPAPVCPVCAGPHPETECPHGSAPALDLPEPEPEPEPTIRPGAIMWGHIVRN
jgi:hypothetical protein